MGNQTTASRVTAGDTHHTEDCLLCVILTLSQITASKGCKAPDLVCDESSGIFLLFSYTVGG